MGIADTAGATLGRKVGPLPIGGWAAIGIGTIVIVKLLKGGSGGGSGTVTIPDAFAGDASGGGGTTIPTPTAPSGSGTIGSATGYAYGETLAQRLARLVTEVTSLRKSKPIAAAHWSATHHVNLLTETPEQRNARITAEVLYLRKAAR